MATDATTRSATFSPLAELLPAAERTTPELRYWESTYAALASYQVAARLLAEAFPLGRTLHASAVRTHAQQVARRLEDELGEESRLGFSVTCPRDWEELPRPDLPLAVGLDGGYVHSSQQTSRKDGWFEGVAGRSMPTDGRAARSFAFVQTFDTKPRRRLYEVLKAQGMADNQQVTFLTDGGEDIRDLPRFLDPQADHLVDWFHITMRTTVLRQMTKCLPTSVDPDTGPATTAARADRKLQSAKCFLWHGNVYYARQEIDDLVFVLEGDSDLTPKQQALYRRMAQFQSYLRLNVGRIPNYGERYRCGEAISTGFAESAVNQMVSKRMAKKQQMRWSPRGAHLLLQPRTRVLDDTLAGDFARWYPGAAAAAAQEPVVLDAAAYPPTVRRCASQLRIYPGRAGEISGPGKAQAPKRLLWVNVPNWESRSAGGAGDARRRSAAPPGVGGRGAGHGGSPHPGPGAPRGHHGRAGHPAKQPGVRGRPPPAPTDTPEAGPASGLRRHGPKE